MRMIELTLHDKQSITVAASTVADYPGLALHDQEPERISCLLNEAFAEFSLGIGRPRACGKSGQHGFEPPAKPSER
jgi:hypothetical protein